ncbi:hypothetical protein Dimus_030135 [Dionaea muscipula]
MAPVPPRDWEDHGNIHQIPKREDVCGIHHGSHLSPGKFKNVCTMGLLPPIVLDAEEGEDEGEVNIIDA